MKKLLFRLLNSLFHLEFTTSMKDRIALYRKRGMTIGMNCYIGRNTSFGRGGGDPITIGDNCVLTGCTILGHDASPSLFLEELQGTSIFDRKSYKRTTAIGNNVFIGVNAVVLPGVTIGDNCIIGAGAIVTRDIPSNSVAVGNPAKVISSIENYIHKYKQLYHTHPEYFYTGDSIHHKQSEG